jgi:hypothetical protein
MFAMAAPTGRITRFTPQAANVGHGGFDVDCDGSTIHPYSSPYNWLDRSVQERLAGRRIPSGWTEKTWSDATS